MAIKSAAVIFVVGMCFAFMLKSVGRLKRIIFCRDAKTLTEYAACDLKTASSPYISSCCVVVIAALSFKFAPV